MPDGSKGGALTRTLALAGVFVSQAAIADMPGALALIEPSIVQYRWEFVVPEWVVEPRTVTTVLVVPSTTPRRVDYASLEFDTAERPIGVVPVFSCKYGDFGLPNACVTTWRTLYADVPRAVIRHDYMDVDVPRLQANSVRQTFDVPRLVWKRASLVVSLPAVAIRD